MLENPTTKRTNIFEFQGAEGQDGETFSVCKNALRHEFGSCKTNRNPYTMDVYVCLILMFDLGMLKRINSDDIEFMYPEALAYVKEHYALKHSYAKLQKMGQPYDENSDMPISPVIQRPRKNRKAKANASKKKSRSN